MIEDFGKVVNAVRALDADLCIVGCGPVGIAIAEEFAQTKKRVLVIEGGDLTISPSLQALNEADVAGLPHTGHLDGRGRAVGGTGHLWAGQCIRLNAFDFEPRAWIPYSGWPISAASLRPFYERAERFFDVDGHSYLEDGETDSRLTLPRFEPDALTPHFTVYTPQVNTAQHHVSLLRSSDAVRVLTNAHVAEVTVSERCDAVAGLTVRTLDGRQVEVHSPSVVLAAGGIENARLLLASRSRQPGGLGNGHDLVGRFFQEHPNATTATLNAGDATALQRQFRISFRGGRRYFPKFAISQQQQEHHQILNCNAHLVFEHPDDSGLAALRGFVHAMRRHELPAHPWRDLAAMVRDAGDIALAGYQRVAHGQSPTATPSRIRLQCFLEQAPNPASRLRLLDVTDRLGMPRLCVDWNLTKLEQRTLQVMTDIVRREFANAGLGMIQPDEWLTDDEASWATRLRDCSHHMGTTRMASTPDRGVVDPNSEVFGIAGLFVAGSSVFPTSGYANPTLTAVALGLRLADHLKHGATRAAACETKA